ncbi:hypothetical protein, partial [Streptomyces zhihengii]
MNDDDPRRPGERRVPAPPDDDRAPDHRRPPRGGPRGDDPRPDDATELSDGTRRVGDARRGG